MKAFWIFVNVMITGIFCLLLVVSVHNRQIIWSIGSGLGIVLSAWQAAWHIDRSF